MDGVGRHKGLKPDHYYFIGKQWIFLKDIFGGRGDGGNPLMH